MTDITETPKAAVKRLAASMLGKGYVLEALHQYCDAKSQPLFWRIRLKHPKTGKKWIRPMHRTDNQYVLGEPAFASGKKPLYRLCSLIENPDQPVFICEGEWCVDHLAKLGAIVTTSGAVDSANRADWSALAKRTVIIWPDNDEAGQRYADTVAGILRGISCDIRLIDVAALALPIKGDAVDWLTHHPNSQLAELLKLATVTLSVASSDSKAAKEKKASPVALLVEFVKTRHTLFHDSQQRPYAQHQTTQETKRLDGSQFTQWLAAAYYREHKRTIRDQTVKEAIATLTGLAKFEGQQCEVFIRAAKHEGVYYLDLGESGNSRAIAIRPDAWQVIESPPVRFLRPESLQPLPTPKENGDLAQIWPLVNIPDESQLLVITWLIDALRMDTPFSLLEFIGEQGSAKSTTQELLRQLIDPTSCNLRGAPKNVEDIFIAASQNWVVSYENISHLPAPMQDALCVIATGGSFAKRQLYTNTEESIIVVKRPIMINGISVAVTAQDLIDRTLSIEMPRITLHHHY
ncbi:MAG: hypothetical protein GY782_08190 [Gammaproteobacteria bacterium]|nr:hypothetical protein [Gammaproteobacteria bacterium]